MFKRHLDTTKFRQCKSKYQQTIRLQIVKIIQFPQFEDIKLIHYELYDLPNLKFYYLVFKFYIRYLTGVRILPGLGER